MEQKRENNIELEVTTNATDTEQAVKTGPVTHKRKPKMTAEERKAFIEDAMKDSKVLEGLVTRSDSDLNLYISYKGEFTGIMEYGESEMPHKGEIKKQTIMNKVGRTIPFKIVSYEVAEDGKETIKVSRRRVQEDYRQYIKDNYKVGDVLDGVVTNCESFGVFVDLGYGVSAYMPNDYISICRMQDTRKFFKRGDKVRVAIRRMWDDENGIKMVLTHKELIGTWEENAAKFEVGDVVIGKVLTVNEHGAFIEVHPNLSGLAKLKDGVEEGDTVSVKISKIIPEGMKMKMTIIKKLFEEYTRPELEYSQVTHIDKWVYSPDCCKKVIMTDFSQPIQTKREAAEQE